MHARATCAPGKLVEIFAQHDNEEANHLRLLIYRAGEFEEQSGCSNKIVPCLIRLVISAGNANELTRELFAKSVACSP